MNTRGALDLQGLAAFLRNEGLAGATDLTATLIPGGRSNLTYDVRVDEQHWVLRRPPQGETLETAHDVKREYAVMSALSGSPVPVPRTIAYCADEQFIGAPFYLMDFVDGRVIRTNEALKATGDETQRHLATRLVEVLASLHTLEPDEHGLAGFGRPDGFLQRQVRRWTTQLSATQDTAFPGIDMLASSLAQHVPTHNLTTVVHGDFRLDNCIVQDSDIVAVLDWEMATLGDPIADLATFVVYHHGMADHPNPVVDSPGALPAVPSLPEVLALYERLTGFALRDLDWYLAFAWFKFAVILDGVRRRSAAGLASGWDFADVTDLIQPSVDRGITALSAYRQP